MDSWVSICKQKTERRGTRKSQSPSRHPHPSLLSQGCLCAWQTWRFLKIKKKLSSNIPASSPFRVMLDTSCLWKNVWWHYREYWLKIDARLEILLNVNSGVHFTFPLFIKKAARFKKCYRSPWKFGFFLFIRNYIDKYSLWLSRKAGFKIFWSISQAENSAMVQDFSFCRHIRIYSYMYIWIHMPLGDVLIAHSVCIYVYINI